MNDGGHALKPTLDDALIYRAKPHRNSCHQLRNRPAVIDDRRRAAIEILDRDLWGVDSEMVIDRREEIPRTAGPLDHVLAAFIRGTDDRTCLDAAACPDV